MSLDLDDASVKVLKVLEDHPKLDMLQIASHAEIVPSVVRESIRGLVSRHLLKDARGVYSLDKAALRALLASA